MEVYYVEWKYLLCFKFADTAFLLGTAKIVPAFVPYMRPPLISSRIGFSATATVS